MSARDRPFEHKPLLALIVVAVGARAAFTQGNFTPPIYRAPRVRVAPKIDGRLDDPAWRTAPRARFVLLGEPARYYSKGSTARILWGETNLYLGFRLMVPDTSKLVAEAAERDGRVWLDDAVEIFLDSDPSTPRGYLQFMVTCAGVRMDGGGLDVDAMDAGTM